MTMNAKWTARFFTLARPFVDFDVEATFAALEGLVGHRLPPLEITKAGERRSVPMQSWGSVRVMPWTEKLTVAGVDERIEVAAYLWRLKKSRKGVSASSASYQCHEITIDFPFHCIHQRDIEGVVGQLLSAASACHSELGVLCPLEGGALRQLYRERGLEEGVPDVFEITVLGPRFAHGVDVAALRARLPPSASIKTSADQLAIVSDTAKIAAMGPTRKAELRAAIGEHLFAGPRESEAEGSGVFSLFELLRMHRRMREADKNARHRSSSVAFAFDWSGVFENGAN